MFVSFINGKMLNILELRESKQISLNKAWHQEYRYVFRE